MIRFELHTHSDASPDSNSKIQEIIRECEKKKIDAIAITDHDVAFDMKKLKGINTKVVVVPGIEVSTIDDSHIIGLFIEEPIKAKKHLEVIDEIHKKGGLAVMAHPFRRWQGYLTPLIKRKNSEIEAVLNKIDAVFKQSDNAHIFMRKILYTQSNYVVPQSKASLINYGLTGYMWCYITLDNKITI